MTGNEALRFLGSPEVRNAILLNEIGVLLHELGKLSAEYVSVGSAFPHHLILRRLTRGVDPFLGSEMGPLPAVLYALRNCPLTDGERSVAALLDEALDALAANDRASARAVSDSLERALVDLRYASTPDHLEAIERVGCLARGVLADQAWQADAERGLEEMEPPLFSAEGFREGLDQLPFVADLVEMQGRTWHPEDLLPPEVRLFREIHQRVELRGTPQPCCDVEHLAAVRELSCEALANQLLEINNIRKDGPGDLGSWFWKSRLCARSEEAMALLRAFDQGAELGEDERAEVRWLGVRPIVQWAFGKIQVETSGGGSQTSLWEHCRTLSALYKSSVAHALLEGLWPQGPSLSWCTLTVGLELPDPGALQLVKGLVEVEYPLGNELRRRDTEILFTFPGLGGELATALLEALRAEVDRLTGGNTRHQVTLGHHGVGESRHSDGGWR